MLRAAVENERAAATHHILLTTSLSRHRRHRHGGGKEDLQNAEFGYAREEDDHQVPDLGRVAPPGAARAAPE